MKKLLAMLMALMLVLTVTAGMVVMADEPAAEATETTEAPEAAQPELPADYDESTIKQYLVYDFSDLTKVTTKMYMTANDGTLDYMGNMYKSYGQPVKEDKYEGKRALVLSENEFALKDAANMNDFAYVVENGLFAKNHLIVFPFGTLAQNGEAGTLVATVVITRNDKTESHDLVVGENNTFMYKINEYDWVKVAIAVMILIVLALLVIIILVVSKKKKRVNAEEAETFESDFILEDLANNAGEISEEVEETIEESKEEVVEEIVEEVVEETTEETTEEN